MINIQSECIFPQPSPSSLMVKCLDISSVYYNAMVQQAIDPHECKQAKVCFATHDR